MGPAVRAHRTALSGGQSGGGRPPLSVERMFRIYCLQQWYNLSDPGAEEALYDSLTMRQFAGVRTDADVIPDETSILKFRRLLDEHKLTDRLFTELMRIWASPGCWCARARSWMRRSSTRLLRPRTPSRNATPRCIRRQRQAVVLRHESAYRHRLCFPALLNQTLPSSLARCRWLRVCTTCALDKGAIGNQ